MHRAWWLHSLWALGLGAGVMLVARRGLAHVDKLLLLVAGTWIVVFVALRLVAGEPAVEGERLAKRGARLLTNYVIKNLYQQMFFFQVPLYASSATWALDSPNAWLPVVLGMCAVVSTMDLVFDNVIMTRRWLAALLYGVCLFALLNLILPLALFVSHREALLLAAAAAPPATVLLSFRLATVVSPLGLIGTAVTSTGLAALAWFGAVAVPPAPLAMAYGAVGHGTPGQYEVLPGKITRIRASQLADLRCVTLVTDLGRAREPLVHVWRHRDQVIERWQPADVAHDERRSRVVISWAHARPADPLGPWSCTLETADGQLVGRIQFDVIREAE
jgi:hypothetical protein